jgi:hypothetical protein
MRNDVLWVRNQIGANARNIGTGLNHEIETFRRFSMGIIARETADSGKHFEGQCELCQRRSKRLFRTGKRTGRQACIDCLFPANGHKNESRPPRPKSVPTETEQRVIQLFRCFGCGTARAADLMSSLLFLCRGCSANCRSLNSRDRIDFAERAIRKIRRFMRRQI